MTPILVAGPRAEALRNRDLEWGSLILPISFLIESLSPAVWGGRSSRFPKAFRDSVDMY